MFYSSSIYYILPLTDFNRDSNFLSLRCKYYIHFSELFHFALQLYWTELCGTQKNRPVANEHHNLVVWLSEMIGIACRSVDN